MSTKYPLNQIEKLIDFYQRYDDIDKLAVKIMSTLPGPFDSLFFEETQFCPALPLDVAVTSKRASNHRLRDAVRYLVQCYWYAGIVRDIPVDMIELALDYNREIDKRHVPEALSNVIRRLTRRVVGEFRRQGVSCGCYSHPARPSGGEFKIQDTLLTISVSRHPPSHQEAIALLLNFFLYRSAHPDTHAIGIINPVIGCIYTLPILGVSQDRAYQYNLLHDILAR